ncbi:uncharacterized protein KQ657_001838 [Scheffersomyces spartinae]|uniref:Uncharacterized protein n=1 Tax=Scheffersomyces spartinae TaxID=45513 RepID=A0A9P7V765_9ASCO|nr:uncharacterized protein KQ657_001838 [Scheffersomyces spartinae]KAG7192437.1 hypothetical protein KQ657_001838 [Scheffersomyces spartinae]
MEEPLDITYYLGPQGVELLNNLDVPLSNGEIVSINLRDELPEDPLEIITFLETENVPRQFWVSVAGGYAQNGKLEEAQSVAEKGLSKLVGFLEEDKKALQGFLTWLYLKKVLLGIEKNSNINRARESIEKLQAVGGNKELSNLLLKAIVYLFEDRFDKALEILDRVLKENGNNCFALMAKAQIILNKTKNYSNALKLYQQVLVTNPTMSPDPRIGVGICFWFLKDESMAIQAWKRALELNPSNIKAKILVVLSEFNNAFNNSLSDEEFKHNYTTCLKQVSTLYKENVNDISILLVLASYFLSKGDYDTVEKIVNKIRASILGEDKFELYTASKLSGKLSSFQSVALSQCFYWLGRVSFNKNDFTQSQKYFHESIKLNESNLLAKLGLGQSQYNRGSVEESLITFESILKTNPKCLEVLYLLGCLYSKQSSRRKQEAAIHILEKYIRLSNNKGYSNPQEFSEFYKREPVILNSYLILSELYESRDFTQSLVYLQKAVESRKQVLLEAPLEVYNNIGVFNFMKNNFALAVENFSSAVQVAEKDSQGSSSQLIDDIKITLSFNLARSKEEISEEEATSSNIQKDSVDVYDTILKEQPAYYSAKLRLLFLQCLSTELPKKEILEALETLLSDNDSNLEVRSFYGWFIKNFGKKLGLVGDSDANHQKETLVQYNSHDCYALVSLANIYCIMARDLKDNDNNKKRKYYIRAVELFAKVLSVDSKNVFAAQGLAIVYLENKEVEKGLEILRKIRDSLNDISIYVNLGHAYAECKQFSKSIEHYEIALARFSDGNDTRLLTFLGKTWYMRGLYEKNLNYLKKAKQYAEEVLEKSGGTSAAFKFNVAYIDYQIAEFITKQRADLRSVDEIKSAILNLNTAITILKELALDEEKNPPYPKSELNQRALLGQNTLLNRLNMSLEETVSNIENVEQRLEEAKKLRREEEDRKLKEEEERNRQLALKEEEMAKERLKLQEQAQQWAEEQRANIGVDESDGDGDYNNNGGDAGDAGGDDSNKKKRKKNAAKPGRRGKKKAAVVDDIINDDSEESAVSSGEEQEPNSAKASPKKRKKKAAIVDDEEEDDVDEPDNSKKRKKKALSKEIIEDSDDELDDDLFGDDNE